MYMWIITHLQCIYLTQKLIILSFKFAHRFLSPISKYIKKGQSKLIHIWPSSHFKSTYKSDNVTFTHMGKNGEQSNHCHFRCHSRPLSRQYWICTPGHSPCRRRSWKRWCSCSDQGRGPQSPVWPWPSAARSVFWWTATSWTCCPQWPPTSLPLVSGGKKKTKCRYQFFSVTIMRISNIISITLSKSTSDV